MVQFSRDRMRRIGWTLVLLVILLILLSAFLDPRVPWLLTLAIVGVAVVTLARPGSGLLIVVALVPFAHVIVTRVWPAAYPFGVAEALVLAYLAGFLVREIAWPGGRPSLKDAVTVSSWLLAACVAASCLVLLAVLRVWHDYPLRFAESFAVYLGTKYLLVNSPDPRPWIDGHGIFNAAVYVFEGLALLGCARRLTAEEPVLARRVARTAVIAGSVAAALSIVALVSAAAAEGQAVSVLMREGRWSFVIPSVNTSGPYFMLVAFLAAAEALTPGARHRQAWWVAAAVALVGMALTQTRSSIVSGLAIGLAAGVWSVASRLSLPPARTLVAACLVALATGLVVVFVNPFGLLAEGIEQSLEYRMAGSMTAIWMTAAHPWFGVGIGQYAVQRHLFTPPEMFARFPSLDAHNQFAWVAAELGLVGVAAFVWLIASVLLVLWRSLRDRPRDARLLVTSAGLAAFVVTWIIGQPISIPQAGYTFWIVAGAAIGWAGGTGQARPLGSSAVAGATAVALALCVSIPFRAATAIGGIDLSRAAYGVHRWEEDETGVRFRWTHDRATLFMREDARLVELPMTAARRPPGAPDPTVEIFVNDRLLDRLTLAGRDLQRVRIEAPPEAGPYWRIDLHVSPTWDPPVLGVRPLGIVLRDVEVIARRPAPVSGAPVP